jgi:hypothetical protein
MKQLLSAPVHPIFYCKKCWVVCLKNRTKIDASQWLKILSKITQIFHEQIYSIFGNIATHSL